MTELRHLTLRERIHDEIVRMIVSGELPPGASLDERALVERLSVSRTPFREAIGTLAKEGLIEIRPYRGFNVRSFTPKEVNDLYELRKTLEGLAIRLAVANISNRDIIKLEEMLDAGVTALRDGDMAGYAEHDRAFHETIAELSDNHALVDALSRLSLQIQICRVFANQSPELAERAARERDAILGALRQRDAAAAERLMIEHITDVQRAVIERLATMEAPPAPRSARGRKRRLQS